MPTALEKAGPDTVSTPRHDMSQTSLEIEDTLPELIAIAIKRIQDHEPLEGYYLAFSGGKDSIVLYDLISKSGVKFDAHYHFTTVDPPELVRFIKANYPEVIWERPKHSMFKLIETKGFPPTRQIRYCCERLKERAAAGRTVATGVRREESTARSNRPVFHRDDRIKSKLFLNPIVDWKEKTVWDYIDKNNLKYCSLYDEGFDRIGCIMCPLQGSAQMIKEMNRWPKYARAYKEAIGRGIKLKREKGKASYKYMGTKEEVFHWWIYAEHVPCSEQCLLLG